MARLVPARASRDVIKRRRKVVHYLALAFIAPLRAHDYNRLHQPVTPLLSAPDRAARSGKLGHTPPRRSTARDSQGGISYTAEYQCYMPPKKKASQRGSGKPAN
jgi:hypothetical protein